MNNFTIEQIFATIWRTNCQPATGIQTHCHATAAVVLGPARLRSTLGCTVSASTDSRGEGLAKDNAFLAFALCAMRGPFHFDFPRQRVAATPRSETNFFKQPQRHGIGAHHEEPDARQFKFLTTKAERSQE